MEDLNKQIPPKGYYINTKEWVNETIKKNEINKYYKEIYPANTTTLPAPKGIDPLKWDLNCKFNEAFTAIIPNGRVFGLHGNVITPNNKVLWDVSRYPKNPTIEFENYFPKKLPKINFLNETVAHVAHILSNAYHHWFWDILPRLHLLQKNNLTIDKYLFWGHFRYPIQHETLSILGIPKEKIIYTSKPFHIEAKKLIVSSSVFSCPKWASNYLRKDLVEKMNIKKLPEYERIYLSREDAGHRKVSNEDDVFGILKKYGFKKVILSGLSINKVANIFNSAKVVISPHSAGLSSHLIFCNPGTKIIEIYYKEMIVNFVWRICSHLKLDYYHMTCERGGPPAIDERRHHLYVDPNKLVKVLEYSGIK